ncbi:MAG: hypothetical protein KBG28_11305 [Kofleriaceae bacterium]|jgi:hypothetical protein|nr:hypothetical protein [Kofleriaceae bacterium]MBP6837069.1 hypothetical protein [Kofleriaceae bacterium]MBP9204545.1 hypothetical protein [Kofleriaceae bacterium]
MAARVQLVTTALGLAAAATLLGPAAGCGQFGFTTQSGQDPGTADARAGADGGAGAADAALIDAPFQPGVDAGVAGPCLPGEVSGPLSWDFGAGMPAWATTYIPGNGQGGQVSVVAGALELGPVAGATPPAYWGVNQGGTTYDLRGRRIAVEIASTVQGPSTQTLVQITPSQDVWAQMFESEGQLALELTPSPALYLTYDPTSMRWWQMRESAGVLHFEVSPNGRTWTEVRRVSTPAWYGAASIELAAGYHEASTPSGVSRYDNLRMCGP